MDEKRSKAVTEAFVRLYREGLIYRSVCSWTFFVYCFNYSFTGMIGDWNAIESDFCLVMQKLR